MAVFDTGVAIQVLVQHFDRLFQLSAEDETPARIEELVHAFRRQKAEPLRAYLTRFDTDVFR